MLFRGPLSRCHNFASAPAGICCGSAVREPCAADCFGMIGACQTKCPSAGKRPPVVCLMVLPEQLINNACLAAACWVVWAHLLRLGGRCCAAGKDPTDDARRHLLLLRPVQQLMVPACTFATGGLDAAQLLVGVIPMLLKQQSLGRSSGSTLSES